MRRINIKQKASYTKTKLESRKGLWKTNDTDSEEQDTQRVALLFRELLLHKP